MKINITELIANPNNPRKISKDKKARLKQSILLFPKMLYYRDITINKENMVLGGNQRTDILKEILKSSPMDWILTMSENSSNFFCKVSRRLFTAGINNSLICIEAATCMAVGNESLVDCARLT